MTHGRLYQYFAGDHRRLEGLLEQAARQPERIDHEAYGRFRIGLLKHISMEEKILLPAAQHYRGGKLLPIASKLRLDHGAIASLLVPPPSRAIIAALRAILAAHDVLEEQVDGLYEVCERLAGGDLDALMEKVLKAPEVPPMPHNDRPAVLDATRRALARAGYNFDDYVD